MAQHTDSGWRPTGDGMQYKGYEVWDYDRGPHEINEGQVEPEDDLKARNDDEE